MNKKVLIIILAVVVVAVGVFVFLQMSNKGENDGEKAVELNYYPTGDYLVTNLKDGKTLIKVTVVLGLGEEGKTEYLTANNAAIRDRIVFVLRGHAKEDFQDNGSLQALSQEICQAINQELNIDYVTRAYFNDFVVQ